MNNRAILFLGLGLLAYRYFNDKSTANRFLVGLRVQIKKVQPAGKELKITFNFQNPNSAPAVVKSFFGEVWLNGQKFGQVKTTKQVVIKPNDETDLTLTVKLNVVRAILSLIDLTGGVANSVVRVTGTVNLNDRAQPVDVKYTII